MIKRVELRVEPHVAYDEGRLTKVIAAQTSLSLSRLKGVRVVRRSIDARQRRVMVNLSVDVAVDEPLALNPLVPPIEYRKVGAAAPRAIVVGAGPGGLFAALRLIELGIRPVVIERGKNVRERRVDVARISREGIVDPDSNYCFGEGGAGAYSDGKLYTRSKKRGDVTRILGIFHCHGASENVLIDAHPHIGSDRLPAIIERMRQTILDCGGEVHFGCRVTGLTIEGDSVTGIVTADGTKYAGPVILATGHSARDVYDFLTEQGVTLEEKGIAVGVRLEHPQHVIDQIQYHSAAGRGQWLPAAEYSFVTQVDGRGVYSFCMCPGGVIVPAASAPGELVVNGMSPGNRGTYWANSGMVVEVRPDDVPAEYARYGVKRTLEWQRGLERECFRQAGETQQAGAQRMTDFVEGRSSKLIPPSSYAPGLQPSRLDRWLPAMVAGRLRKAFKTFDRQRHGFLCKDAIVIGVESRTSSPIRIPRDNLLMHHIAVKGLYPCGEGAGYAGGIVSSAIDGERCAEALAAQLLATGDGDFSGTP